MRVSRRLILILRMIHAIEGIKISKRIAMIIGSKENIFDNLLKVNIIYMKGLKEMTNISDELIQKLVSEKKYETIQEFASVSHMGQKPLCFHEYNGTEIRAFEQDGNINVLYP